MAVDDLLTIPEELVNSSGVSRGAILVLDEDPSSREKLCTWLVGQSFYPLAVATAEAVLSLAVQIHPLIIILDTQAKGLGGLEVCRRLKADAETRDIPVVFLGNQDEDEAAAFEAGGDDFLFRPIRSRLLLARINQFVLLYDLMSQLDITDRLFTKYTTQFSVTSEVGRQITSILEPANLATAVVGLLQSSFDYYHVSLWQINDRQDKLILRASMGRSGNQPLPANFSLPKEPDRSIISAVACSSQMHLAPDVRSDPLYMLISDLPDTLSELALPLHIGMRMVGVLDIQSDRLEAFDAEDCMILQSLADQVSVAMRNAELYELQNRRRFQSELLEKTGRVLSSTLDASEVQSRILTELAGVLPYNESYVFRVKENNLQLMAARGGQSESLQGDETIIPKHAGSVLWQTIDSSRPLMVDDVQKAPGCPDLSKLSSSRSWIGAPLLSHDRVVGILTLARAEANAFGPSEVIFLSTFAAQAEVALENAELYAEIRRLNENLEKLVSERTRQLDEAYRTLKKMDKAKSDFINIAAHELRTPLTVMKGYLSMMRSDQVIKENAMLSTSVNGVWTGTNRLHEIVNSMLDVARINNQTLTLACQWIHLRDVLAQVKEEFGPDLAQRSQKLEVEHVDQLPLVYADPSLMYKVFANLVVNAIKYTPDGRCIDITAQALVAEDGAPQVQVQVHDTGIGINPEEQELIFDQFYQTGQVALHSSGRSKFKGGGPGLGLAIARGIVLAHKGRIWVESSGQDEHTCPGSCFCVSLPVSGPETETP